MKREIILTIKGKEFGSMFKKIERLEKDNIISQEKRMENGFSRAQDIGISPKSLIVAFIKMEKKLANGISCIGRKGRNSFNIEEVGDNMMNKALRKLENGFTEISQFIQQCHLSNY
ncbi:unnamed protein product [Paramecium pentaurelia]|uniref:Uncharacterized protein n=1 Tax=Paramecium pentaurelia TaxID=43138 RepID=A0A8S1TDG3_9CILI|nr:unnamed protein product [Paramecium pentaurelia]